MKENYQQKAILARLLKELTYAGKVLNQTDFGQKLGYTKSHFSQIMNGKENLTPKIITAIETQLNVSRSFLEQGTEPVLKGKAYDNTPAETIVQEPEELLRTRLIENEIRKAIDIKATQQTVSETMVKSYSSVEAGALYMLGVSHQTSLLDETNIDILMKTVEKRVQLILREVIAVKSFYKKLVAEKDELLKEVME